MDLHGRSGPDNVGIRGTQMVLLDMNGSMSVCYPGIAAHHTLMRVTHHLACRTGTRPRQRDVSIDILIHGRHPFDLDPHSIGTGVDREHPAIHKQDAPIHKRTCPGCQIKHSTGHVLAEKSASSQSRLEGQHTSSVPILVAGLARHGREPTTLRSPSGR